MGESGDLCRFTERFFLGEDPQRFKDVWRIWDAEKLVVLMEATPPNYRRQVMDDLIQEANECINQEVFKIAKKIKEKKEMILRDKEKLARLEAQLRRRRRRQQSTGPPPRFTNDPDQPLPTVDFSSTSCAVQQHPLPVAVGFATMKQLPLPAFASTATAPRAQYSVQEMSWLYHVHSTPVTPVQTVTTGGELAPLAQVTFEVRPLSKATGHDPQIGPSGLLLSNGISAERPREEMAEKEA